MNRSFRLIRSPVETGSWPNSGVEDIWWRSSRIGLATSFENVHKALGFRDLFDALAVSETVGAVKPDRGIFDAATQAPGLTEDDYPGCVKVGNNLEGDFAGANRLGMHSVWNSWSKNYPTEPAKRDQRLDFEIKLPHEFFDVLDEINASG